MSLRRWLTTTDVSLNAWEISVLIRNVDGELNRLAAHHEDALHRFGHDAGNRSQMWDMFWEMGCVLHDAEREVLKTIDVSSKIAGET